MDKIFQAYNDFRRQSKLSDEHSSVAFLFIYINEKKIDILDSIASDANKSLFLEIFGILESRLNGANAFENYAVIEDSSEIFDSNLALTISELLNFCKNQLVSGTSLNNIELPLEISEMVDFLWNRRVIKYESDRFSRLSLSLEGEGAVSIINGCKNLQSYQLVDLSITHDFSYIALIETLLLLLDESRNTSEDNMNVVLSKAKYNSVNRDEIIKKDLTIVVQSFRKMKNQSRFVDGVECNTIDEYNIRKLVYGLGSKVKVEDIEDKLPPDLKGEKYQKEVNKIMYSDSSAGIYISDNQWLYSPRYKKLRKWLLNHHVIDCIIALPMKLLNNSGIQLYLTVFKHHGIWEQIPEDLIGDEDLDLWRHYFSRRDVRFYMIDFSSFIVEESKTQTVFDVNKAVKMLNSPEDYKDYFYRLSSFGHTKTIETSGLGKDNILLPHRFLGDVYHSGIQLSEILKTAKYNKAFNKDGWSSGIEKSFMIDSKQIAKDQFIIRASQLSPVSSKISNSQLKICNDQVLLVPKNYSRDFKVLWISLPMFWQFSGDGENKMEFIDPKLYYNSSKYFAFHVKHSEYDGEWLAMVLNQTRVRNDLNRLAIRMSTQQKILREDILNLWVDRGTLLNPSEQSKKANQFQEDLLIGKESIFTPSEIIKRDRFSDFASMNHTMGTYRSNISSYSRILKKYFSQSSKDLEKHNKSFKELTGFSLVEIAERIGSNINHISGLLESFANGESYEDFEIKPVEIKWFKDWIYSYNFNLIKTNCVEFEINQDSFKNADSVTISFNEKLFRSLIENIISNCEKHGFENKDDYNRIVIEMNLEKESLLFVIKNNGKPIPDDITKKFIINLGATTNLEEGSGIGGNDIDRIAHILGDPDWDIVRGDSRFPVKYAFNFPFNDNAV